VKVIIAGSRTIFDYQLVLRAISESGFEITEVVSGKAPGVDRCGEWWAINNNIPVKEFPASFRGLGRAAGPIRNAEMAEYADALICVHNGSRGSANMMRVARAMGLKIFEKRVAAPVTKY